MNNAKMGELIRSARKAKGLTQKDVAERLGITDRAVSKWERSICAPDIALLEELAEILGVSIAELISGERHGEPCQEEVHSEEVETAMEAAIKETITYSQKEISAKKRVANRRGCLFGAFAVIFSIVVCFCVLWYKGFFHVIGKYPSPDGHTITTVYDCRMGYGDIPSAGGFTVSDKGYFAGRTIYPEAEFKGLWWSPNGCYQVVSMYTEGKTWLSLTDYTRNIGANLSSRLRRGIYENTFFDDVPYDADGWRAINFDFIQWSEADPEKMPVYFNYADIHGRKQEGYMWYDYESGEVSGEMRIEQGEKGTDPINDLLSDGIQRRRSYMDKFCEIVYG